MTYGVIVPARKSWPVILAKLSGETVYNMGWAATGQFNICTYSENLTVSSDPRPSSWGSILGTTSPTFIIWFALISTGVNTRM